MRCHYHLPGLLVAMLGVNGAFGCQKSATDHEPPIKVTAFTPPTSAGDGTAAPTGSWTVLSTQWQPSARAYHTAVWSGDRMIVFGGEDKTENGPLGDGGAYSPAS